MFDRPSGFADFVDADHSPDAQRLLKFLDRADQLDFFREVRRRSIELMALVPGSRVLGIGCGTGTALREMAADVPGGQVVGMDLSAFLLQTARRRAMGLDQVDLALGDAQRLPFANRSFDACRAERVFMYLADPVAAFAELVRVTRPGGRIVMFDPDMEGWMIDSPDRAVTRKVMNFWCDQVANGWMGRRWPGLFRDFGLVDIRVEPLTLTIDDFELVSDVFLLRRTLSRAVDSGGVSPEEADLWFRELADRGRAGRFFFATTNLLVAGRKP